MTTKIHRSISQIPIIWALKSARWTRVRVFFGTRMHAICHRYFDHLDSVIQWKALIQIFICPSILLIINTSLTVEQSCLLISLSLSHPLTCHFSRLTSVNLITQCAQYYGFRIFNTCTQALSTQISPTGLWEKLFTCEEDGCQPCVLHCIYVYVCCKWELSAIYCDVWELHCTINRSVLGWVDISTGVKA